MFITEFHFEFSGENEFEVNPHRKNCILHELVVGIFVLINLILYIIDINK